MFLKVLKYEFRACSKIMLPLYGCSAAAAGLVRLMVYLVSKMSAVTVILGTSIFTFLSIVLALGTFFVTIAVVIMRFYSSMAGKEAYLTFTLPVKPTTHLIARLISGFIYIFGAIILIGLGICMFIPKSDWLFIGKLGGRNIVSLIMLILCLSATSALSAMTLYQASIALGSRLNKNHVAGSVVAYLIINTAEQIITAILMLICYTNLVRGGSALFEWIVSRNYNNPTVIIQGAWILYSIVLIFTLLLIATNCFIMFYIYNKKLNVE